MVIFVYLEVYKYIYSQIGIFMITLSFKTRRITPAFSSPPGYADHFTHIFTCRTSLSGSLCAAQQRKILIFIDHIAQLRGMIDLGGYSIIAPASSYHKGNSVISIRRQQGLVKSFTLRFSTFEEAKTQVGPSHLCPSHIATIAYSFKEMAADLVTFDHSMKQFLHHMPPPVRYDQPLSNPIATEIARL